MLNTINIACQLQAHWLLLVYIITANIAQGIKTADCMKLVFIQGGMKQIRVQTEKQKVEHGTLGKRHKNRKTIN